MGFQVSNFTSRAFLMKILQMLFVFIVFMIFRLADSGDAFHWGSGPLVMTERAENDMILGILASTGYFFIVLVLMVGIVMGDTSKFSMCLFNLFGFLFYIAAGSSQIYIYRSQQRPTTGKHKANAMGAMAILTSFTFLVDTVWSVMDIVKGEEKEG
eukprot:TRINITY_DN23911_c0_g1_i1.p1 TRINITY_DN23911_c0_g1~~TRINITY_DN23911_c0_g1_i1.p1  ORF type:complete len:156 (-),score=25.89 TRINITY_DN23911_c0_g1_i1:96-563(-)